MDRTYNVDKMYLPVRGAHFVEGMSVCEAARLFGLSGDTLRNVLEFSVPPGYRRERPTRGPKLDPYKGVTRPRRTCRLRYDGLGADLVHQGQEKSERIQPFGIRLARQTRANRGHTGIPIYP